MVSDLSLGNYQYWAGAHNKSHPAQGQDKSGDGEGAGCFISTQILNHVTEVRPHHKLHNVNNSIFTMSRLGEFSNAAFPQVI